MGWHEGQTRAAGERLPQAHAGMDAERLGRLRDLADQLLATRLGSEGGRALEQRRAAARGDDELESRKHRADDRRHEHMFATKVCQSKETGPPSGMLARDA